MKSKRRKKIEGKVGEFLLRRIQKSVMKKSPEGAEAYGMRLGQFLYRIGKSRVRRCLENLELAFPEMSGADREALSRRIFEHFGIVSADFLRGPVRSMEEFYATTEIVGAEHLDAALEKRKGVVMITGHFGNWDRCSTWAVDRGHTIHVVAREADTEGVNAFLMSVRTANGTNVIPRGAAARPMIEALRRNELVGIFPDQNSDEIYIPFFGKPAGTALGPGVIAERTGSPVVPIFCVRLGPCKYRIEVFPELEAEAGYPVKGEGVMRAINANLEMVIRRHPEQWLWFHDRWRNAKKKGLI